MRTIHYTFLVALNNQHSTFEQFPKPTTQNSAKSMYIKLSHRWQTLLDIKYISTIMQNQLLAIMQGQVSNVNPFNFSSMVIAKETFCQNSLHEK